MKKLNNEGVYLLSLDHLLGYSLPTAINDSSAPTKLVSRECRSIVLMKASNFTSLQRNREIKIECPRYGFVDFCVSQEMYEFAR